MQPVRTLPPREEFYQIGFVEPLTIRHLIEQAIEQPTRERIILVGRLFFSLRWHFTNPDEINETLDDFRAILQVERDYLDAIPQASSRALRDVSDIRVTGVPASNPHPL